MSVCLYVKCIYIFALVVLVLVLGQCRNKNHRGIKRDIRYLPGICDIVVCGNLYIRKRKNPI